MKEVSTESAAHCFILNEALAILGLIDGFCPVEIKSHHDEHNSPSSFILKTIPGSCILQSSLCESYFSPIRPVKQRGWSTAAVQPLNSERYRFVF